MEAIEKIEEFTKNVSESKFMKDKMLQYALVKCFEIIGEASYWTTKDLRNKYSEVNWINAISFRHILVHDYFKIKIDIVWNTAKIDIPVLKKQIQ